MPAARSVPPHCSAAIDKCNGRRWPRFSDAIGLDPAYQLRVDKLRHFGPEPRHGVRYSAARPSHAPRPRRARPPTAVALPRLRGRGLDGLLDLLRLLAAAQLPDPALVPDLR